MTMPSPNAAADLLRRLEAGEIDFDADESLGSTDCREGCHVEPDGRCPHGYESAGLTSGLL